MLGYGEGDNQLNIKSINNNLPYLEKNVGKYGLKSSILVDRRFESSETLKAYGQSILNDLSEPYVNYKVEAIDLSAKDKKFNPFMPCDYVLIRDNVENVNIKMPIMSVKKTNINSDVFSVQLELANKNQNITGSISDIMSRTRINETYSQGATNLQQISFTDNADSNYPASFKFYIPEEMARINKLILNYTLEDFRAYSKAIKGGGATSDTTDSGGGEYTSTDSGGGGYTTTDSGGGEYDTTHGIDDVRGGNVYRTVTTGRGSGNFVGYAEDYHVYSHEHHIELRAHRHDVDLPSHRHSISISSHRHSFTLPNHTHEIKYGIYEGHSANSAYLKIDSKTIYNYEKEVNLVPYLSKDNSGKIERGTWHTVEIVPNGLTRINASLFIQLFTNSRGGGDY